MLTPDSFNVFSCSNSTINMFLFLVKTGSTSSSFYGNKPIRQFLLQPILIFAVLFHFIGMFLEYKNNKARDVSYAYNKPAANSSWVSRNMIISGLTVLAFLVLHFIDFWIPEISTKYMAGDMSGLLPSGEYRYYHELQEKFVSTERVIAYVVAFVFLALHLLHGFQSSFQSVGFRRKSNELIIKKLSYSFALIIPLGFIFVAIFHYLNH